MFKMFMVFGKEG